MTSTTLRIGDIVTITKGKKHSVTDEPSKTSRRIIAIGDLRNDNCLRYTNDPKGVESDKNDILIAWDGANAGTIGYGKEGFIGSTLARLRLVDKNKICTEFIGDFLKSKFDYLRKTATGATIPHISKKALTNIAIPNIEFDDQRRVAQILGKTEKLINERKKNIHQLDDLVKSIFMDMFSPSAEGYENWEVKEIKDLVASHKRAMRTGPFGSNLKHDEFIPDGKVSVLGIDNAVQNKFAWGERRFITEKKYQELKNYTVFPGDVIVTIMGTIGRSAVIPDDIPLAINTKHLAAITLDLELANPTFISYSIHSSPYILNQFKSKNRGAIMSGLNLGIIKKTKIKLPPIELQNKFAELYSKVDNIKTIYKSHLSDLETLYRALSQKAFKGELDLSGVPLLKEHISNAPITEKIEKTSENNTSNSIVTLSRFDAAGLNNSELRKSQFSIWFNEWLAHYAKGSNLKINHFWQSVDFTIQDYSDEDDNPFEVDLSDYDHIKSEIFNAIKNGSIEQTTNMIEIEEEVTGKKIIEPGNQIILKKRR